MLQRKSAGHCTACRNKKERVDNVDRRKILFPERNIFSLKRVQLINIRTIIRLALFLLAILISFCNEYKRLYKMFPSLLLVSFVRECPFERKLRLLQRDTEILGWRNRRSCDSQEHELSQLHSVARKLIFNCETYSCQVRLYIHIS